MANSQATEQARPSARKDWELFWRIVAGLMLAVIGWVVWVAYQITPRSLVTPLAYVQHKMATPVTVPGSAEGAQASAIPAANAAAAGAKDGAPAAAGLGAQPAGVQVPASAVSENPAASSQALQDDGLKMATKISTLPSEKAENPSLSAKSPTGSVTTAASGTASTKP